MNTTEAKTMINDLLGEHGFSHLPWEWSRAKRTFGVCLFARDTHEPKGFKFSRDLFMRNSAIECRDVVLHEIAHAIAGHKAGHGPRWKAVARRIGAKPERAYEADAVNSAPKKWVGVCTPGCHDWRRDRLTKAVRHRGRCPKCKSSIDWRQNRAA